jgi:hypothetical protein
MPSLHKRSIYTKLLSQFAVIYKLVLGTCGNACLWPETISQGPRYYWVLHQCQFHFFPVLLRCSWLLRYSLVISLVDSVSHKLMKPPMPFAILEWFCICCGAKVFGSPVGRIGFPSLSTLQS